jgi:ParB family chromosome partitioning protein
METPTPQYAVIPIHQLSPNRWNRRVFRPEGLQNLSALIKVRGVQEPLTVRKVGEGFEIASGHRRFLAAGMAGLTELPCLIKTLSDEEVQDMNIVANMEREDTPPLELARMVKERMGDKMTQDEAGAIYGKGRTWAANLLGFLQIPGPVLESVNRLTLGSKHLLALKAIKSPEIQLQVAKELKGGTLKPQAVAKRAKELGEKASEPKPSPKAPVKEEPWQDYTMGNTWIQINRPFNFFDWTLEEWLESVTEDLYEFMENHPCPVCDKAIAPDAQHPIHRDCKRLQDLKADEMLLIVLKNHKVSFPDLDARLAGITEAVDNLERCYESNERLGTQLWNAPKEKIDAARAELAQKPKIQGDFKAYSGGDGQNGQN